LLFQRADNLLAEVLGVGSHAGSLTQFSLYTQSETALVRDLLPGIRPPV